VGDGGVIYHSKDYTAVEEENDESGTFNIVQTNNEVLISIPNGNSEPYQIYLHDLNGRLVHQMPVSIITSLPTGCYPAGVYILTISGTLKRKSYKIILP
jgi:hypothetical protein